MQEIPEPKNWQEYWAVIAKGLEKWELESRDPQAEKVTQMALAIFSFTIHNFQKKITKNQDIFNHIHPFIIELHDLLRATVICQRSTLLATAALNLRTAFEVSCNILYIYKYESPIEMCKRMEAFYRYEQIVGLKKSRFLEAVPEAEERAFAKNHPYWTSKDGLLKENAKWNGLDHGFWKVADIAGESENYFNNYKITSKFAHGSPLVVNQYRYKGALDSLPEPKLSKQFNINCMIAIMNSLKATCDFFGVNCNPEDFDSLGDEMKKLDMSLKVPEEISG